MNAPLLRIAAAMGARDDAALEAALQVADRDDLAHRVEEVLVEKEARGEGQMLGRTRRNKVVAFPGEPELVGQYTKVVLETTTGATFVGRELGPQELVGTG